MNDDARNSEWNIKPNSVTGQYSWEQAQTALLMDIRQELRKLNNLLNCPNFLGIPYKLDRISKNTHKPKRRKKTPCPQ